MVDGRMIRVCLKCREYMILNTTFENQKKLKEFEDKHAKHTLITTSYSEKDNLECGKVHCEDDDLRDEMKYQK